MGLGNHPNSRARPVPTSVSTRVTNQPTYGGNAKAGIPSRVGLSVFPRLAIVNGASGHKAPAYAAQNYRMALNNRVAGVAAPLVSSLWPIGMANQLNGVAAPRWGMTRTPADGVNREKHQNIQNHVNTFMQRDGQVVPPM